jgi:hypothetical protein
MPLSIRTTVIIMGITAASVITGIGLARRNLVKTIENDMGVSGAVAEQLVAEETARLRAGMRLAAEKYRGLDDETVISDVLSRFMIRNTGNIFVLDHEGSMVVNMNHEMRTLLNPAGTRESLEESYSSLFIPASQAAEPAITIPESFSETLVYVESGVRRQPFKNGFLSIMYKSCLEASVSRQGRLKIVWRRRYVFATPVFPLRARQ